MPKTQPLTISGQKVPGAFFGRLVKLLGVHGAHKALFKARNAKDIVRYCSKGLKDGWLTQYGIEMEKDTPLILRWIDETFLKIKPEPKRVMRLIPCKYCGKFPRPLNNQNGCVINHYCYRTFEGKTKVDAINDWNKDNSPVKSANVVGNEKD